MKNSHGNVVIFCMKACNMFHDFWHDHHGISI